VFREKVEEKVEKFLNNMINSTLQKGWNTAAAAAAAAACCSTSSLSLCERVPSRDPDEDPKSLRFLPQNIFGIKRK